MSPEERAVVNRVLAAVETVEEGEHVREVLVRAELLRECPLCNEPHMEDGVVCLSCRGRQQRAEAAAVSAGARNIADTHNAFLSEGGCVVFDRDGSRGQHYTRDVPMNFLAKGGNLVVPLGSAPMSYDGAQKLLDEHLARPACEGHYDDDATLLSGVGIGEPTYCDGSCKPQRRQGSAN